MPKKNRAPVDDPRAMAPLLSSLNLLPSILENAPLGISVFCPIDGGADWRCVMANPAFPSFSALPAMGRTVRELFPAIAEQAIAALEDVRRTGKPLIRHEVEARLEPGLQQTWWNITGLPLYGGGGAGDGPAQAVFVLALEVTDRVLARRRAEEQAQVAQARAAEAEEERVQLQAALEALHESEAQLTLLFHESPVLVSLIDMQTGRYVRLNRAYEKTIGYTRQEAIGHTPVELGIVDSELHERLLRNASEDVGVAEQELPLRAKGGRLAHVLVSIRPVETRGRRYALTVGRDITDRRMAEEALRSTSESLRLRAEELRQSEERLRELNETLERRVAERTALAEERAQQLRALAAELVRAEERERRRLAGRLHDHMQQILAAAILQLNAAQQRLPAVDARLPINQALELLDEALEAARSLTAELSPSILHDAGLGPALHWLGGWVRDNYNLRVTVQTPDACDAPPIPEDIGALLFHSSRELLFNVVKHAGVQEASIQLSYPTENSICVTVTDQGRGLDASDARGASARGFGLFSIRERLAYAGGRLEVQSEPGQGMRVRMTLPMSEAPRAAIPVQEIVAPGPAERAKRRLRLLLADDHPIVRRGLAQLINSEPDMEVVGEAHDGDEALAQARQLQPDVVLMDVNMPCMDGVEATRRLLAERPATRVIALSMFDDEEQQALMRAAGAVDYVAKGGPPDALLAAIRACHS